MANAGSMVRRRCEHMRPGHSTLPLRQSVLTPWSQPRARGSRLGERSEIRMIAVLGSFFSPARVRRAASVIRVVYPPSRVRRAPSAH